MTNKVQESFFAFLISKLIEMLSPEADLRGGRGFLKLWGGGCGGFPSPESLRYAFIHQKRLFLNIKTQKIEEKNPPHDFILERGRGEKKVLLA